MCNISVRLTADVLPQERVLRRTEAVSDARLSTQLDFKGAGSERDTVEILQLSETGKK